MRRAAAVLTLLVLSGAPAHAAQTEIFGAEPARGGRSFEVRALGETRSAVRVWNRSASPVQLRIYAAPAKLGADGVWAVGYRGQPAAGLDIDVARATVRLARNASAVVPVHVRAARGAAMGAVVVEAQPSGDGIEVVERIALLVRPTGAAGAASGGTARGSIVLFAAVALAVLGRRALARRSSRSSRHRVTTGV